MLYLTNDQLNVKNVQKLLLVDQILLNHLDILTDYTQFVILVIFQCFLYHMYMCRCMYTCICIKYDTIVVQYYSLLLILQLIPYTY